MQVMQGGLTYTIVHPDELRRRLAHGEFFSIVDSRTPDVYAASGRTMVGAIRLPPDQLMSRLNEIPKGQTLLLVADDDKAERMALQLLEDGFTDVWVVQGGFGAWERAGGKTEPARL